MAVKVARWEWVLLAAGIALRTGLGLASIRAQSPTYDEPLHLASGVAAWKTGDHRVNGFWHPPLGSLAAGLLPTLLGTPVPVSCSLLEHPDWKNPAQQYSFANEFLTRNPRFPPDRLMALGRVSILLLTHLLVLGIYFTARAAAGPAAGVVAFLAAVLSPSLTAHGSLVTTDGPLATFFFLAFAALWAWERSPRPAALVAAGAAFGLALGSKGSAMVFLPLIMVWVAFRSRRENPVRKVLLFTATAGAVLVLVYRVVQAPLFLECLRSTSEVIPEGRASFLLGTLRDHGVWYYFPLAFLIKTPLAILLLLPLIFHSSLRKGAGIPLLLWLPGAAYFLFACASPVQIGHRHILPLYPFLFVVLGIRLAPLFSRRDGKIFLAGMGLWMGSAAFAAAPFPLAYFNELAGGSGQGYRWMTDSNVDWGQGLKALKTYLDREGVRDFYFSYFGPVNPAVYGLRCLDVASICPVPVGTDDADPRREKMPLLVVSATNLQGTYYTDPSLFAPLRRRRPLALLARSLLVYDVSGEPAFHRALAKIFRDTGRSAAADREDLWAADLERQDR